LPARRNVKGCGTTATLRHAHARAFDLGVYRAAMQQHEWMPGEAFHAAGRAYYGGDPGWAVNKRGERMAHVVYDPSHPNPGETGPRAGHGRNLATWVFCERDGDGEGLFATPLKLVVDSRLEPGAAIGLHRHDDNEELYYVLEGRVTMTTLAPDGQQATATLSAGDAHAVRLGQAHYGVAGPDGARFLVVAIKLVTSPADHRL
jgi:Cupin domain